VLGHLLSLTVPQFQLPWLLAPQRHLHASHGRAVMASAMQIQFLSIRYMVGRPVAAALLSVLAALNTALEGPVMSFVQVCMLVVGSGVKALIQA
jgi:hypothetical protein